MPELLYDHRQDTCEGSAPEPLPASEKVAKPRNPIWKRAVLSVSLANLSLLTVWTALIRVAADTRAIYSETAPPSFRPVLALLLATSAIAVLIYLLLRLAQSTSRLRGLGIIFLYCITGFAMLQLQQAIIPATSNSVTFWHLGLACATFGFGVLSFRRSKILMNGLLVALSPLLPLLFANALWLYTRPALRNISEGAALAPVQPASPSAPRVVWMIFDEMDYHLAFEARPTGVQMPAFDALTRESIAADHARSPAGYTMIALPSLLTGKRAIDQKLAESDISLKYEGDKAWRNLSSEDTIFRKARQAGLNTGLSGWLHPYCRIMGQDLTACASSSDGWESVSLSKAIAPWPLWKQALFEGLWEGQSCRVIKFAYNTVRSWRVADSTSREAERQRASASDSPGLLSRLLTLKNQLVREQQIASAVHIRDNGLRMAGDPSKSLVFVHVPAPHLPGIWDVKAHRFSATAHSTYFDNLGFANFVLEQVRQRLRDTGTADRTTLLVSADHPFRIKQWKDSPMWDSGLTRGTERQKLTYIPFFLKLPRQTSPVQYHREFNTVVSRELVEGILSGSLQTPGDICRFLDVHTSLGAESNDPVQPSSDSGA